MARQSRTQANSGTSASTEPAPTATGEAIRGELLKTKMQEAGQLLGHYMRAFALYVAIMGAIVKFALDQNSTPDLRTAMAVLGLGLCFLGVVACVFGEVVNRSLLYDIRLLSEALGLPVLRTSILPLRLTTVFSALFVILATMTWIYILRG